MNDLTETNKLLAKIADRLEAIGTHLETIAEAAYAPTDVAAELRALRTGDNPTLAEAIRERDLLRDALDEAVARLKEAQAR